MAIERHGKAIERHGMAIGRRGKAIERRGKAIERRGKAIERRGKAIERHGEAIERRVKAKDHGKDGSFCLGLRKLPQVTPAIPRYPVRVESIPRAPNPTPSG